MGQASGPLEERKVERREAAAGEGLAVLGPGAIGGEGGGDNEIVVVGFVRGGKGGVAGGMVGAFEGGEFIEEFGRVGAGGGDGEVAFVNEVVEGVDEIGFGDVVGGAVLGRGGSGSEVNGNQVDG